MALYRPRQWNVCVYNFRERDEVLVNDDLRTYPGSVVMLLLEPKGGPFDLYGKFLVEGRVGWAFWSDVEVVTS